MTSKPKYTTTEVQACIKRMKAMKAAERAGGVNIYSDALLRVTVVVEVDGDWWLVPKSRDGWSRRQRLRLTPSARLERLRPARHIDAAWLCIPSASTTPEEASKRPARGTAVPATRRQKKRNRHVDS